MHAQEDRQKYKLQTTDVVETVNLQPVVRIGIWDT